MVHLVALGLGLRLCESAMAEPLDTWSIRTSGTAARLTALDFGNGTYVVAGQQGRILTSIDGVQWTNQSSGIANDLYGVAYGNGMFVVSGTFGTILTSTNGVNWTKQEHATANSNASVIYFVNGQYVLVSDNPTIGISSNGIDWTYPSVPVTRIYQRAAFGNGRFVVAGQSSTILTSSDLLHWTPYEVGVSYLTVAFGNGEFVMKGWTSENTPTLLTSSDGLTWISHGPVLMSDSTISFGGNAFVSAGNGGEIFSSADGTNWVSRSSQVTTTFRNVKYVNFTFMAVGDNGTIVQSAPFPPEIVQQPTNQSVLQGGGGNFFVSAVGRLPLSYQWRFGGVDLQGQTNEMLALTSVVLDQAGAYSVEVSSPFGTVISSNAVLTVQDVKDDDLDGIPNYWEAQFGLNPTNALDATNYPPGDQLSYLQKYLYGLDPTKPDTDGDGLSDYDEIFVHGTNPLLADTDGDGIPDQWEIDHGLNPLVQDATQVGPAGVSNWQIYQYDLAHTNQLDQLDPRKPFYAPGTSLYEVLNNGQHTNRFYYDRADRLVGMESSRGLSLAYTYDGNGNLTRQTVLSRASETNGLPVLWQFLHGLTSGTPADGPYGDADGDGWSNYQEWLAGTDPNDPNSQPNLLGNPGTNIASLTLPFTPSNFVVGVGQLNGLGAEEIVLGADGNPGTNNNFLLVLTPAATGWSTQRVDVGAFGVTSLAVGQVTNRPGPAIYAGLRDASGPGRVAEITQTGTNWAMSTLATSTNNAAFVIGVRSTNDLVVTLASTNASDGATFSLAFDTNWNLSLIETNTSHRGLGVLGPLAQSDANYTSLRLLDAGGIRLGRVLTVTNAVYYPPTGKWYLRTPNPSSWTEAQAYARANGGDLATVVDASLNSFLVDELVHAPPSSTCWIGLFRIDCSSAWQWSSGSPSDFTNWIPGQPDCYGGTERFVFIDQGKDGRWNDAYDSYPVRAIVEMSSQEFETAFAPQTTLPEPDASNRLNWRAISLASGSLRGTGGTSILYCFADDKNANDSIDAGDDFVAAEYLVSGTNADLLTLFRQPIASPTPAQSYGLASVNFLNRSNEVFFTGEPDGQVFAWTASGATNPLQRQLFSADHLGKAWHALAGVKTLEAGEALVGLRVDPADPNRCDVILWPPQTSLPNLFSLPETAPAAVVLPSANPLGDFATFAVRLWDAEGNAATPFLQYQFAGSTNWQDASLLALDGAAYNSANRVTALPGGSDHTLVWNALADLGAGVTTNVLLRARAQDFMLVGDWSRPTPFRVATVENPDANTNGIPDAWELQYFGNLDQPADGDFDADGFRNRAEYLAGTDPRDIQSYLHIVTIEIKAVGVHIAWKAGTTVPQYLQRSVDPSDPKGWQDVFTNSVPMAGEFLDSATTNGSHFYRVKIGE